MTLLAALRVELVDERMAQVDEARLDRVEPAGVAAHQFDGGDDELLAVVVEDDRARGADVLKRLDDGSAGLEVADLGEQRVTRCPGDLDVAVAGRYVDSVEASCHVGDSTAARLHKPSRLVPVAA